MYGPWLSLIQAKVSHFELLLLSSCLLFLSREDVLWIYFALGKFRFDVFFEFDQLFFDFWLVVFTSQLDDGVGNDVCRFLRGGAVSSHLEFWVTVLGPLMATKSISRWMSESRFDRGGVLGLLVRATPPLTCGLGRVVLDSSLDWLYFHITYY